LDVTRKSLRDTCIYMMSDAAPASARGSTPPLRHETPPLQHETPPLQHEQCYGDLGFELGRQARLLHLLKAHMAGWAPVGLDWAAFGLLMALLKRGPLRQGELAEVAMLDPSTVSRHTAQLVKAGLVSRQPHPDDGRAVHLVATPAGEAVGRDLIDRRVSMLGRILSEWEPADTETLLRLLRLLNDGLEQHMDDSSRHPPPDVAARPWPARHPSTPRPPNTLES
jgi:DNA-binding MarR family transcriptional regulator